MSEVPEGWTLATLGDVISGFETGRNFQAAGVPAEAGQQGVLKISAVTWGRFQPNENKALLPGSQSLPHERVNAGDLLISRANTTELVGAPVLVDRDYPNLMLPDKILRVAYNDRVVDPRFLLQALRSRTAREHIERNATGTSDSMRNLSQPKLREIPIPLPPFPEQKRIADKLDTLLARVDACRNHLARVPAILKRFRQSVVAAATSGKLSEEWRRSGNSPVSYRSFPIDDDSIDIPDHWAESTLIELIDPKRPLCYGVVQPGDHDPDGVSLIRVQDMVNRTVVTEQLRTISQDVDSEYKRSRVRAGDLLISVVGTIGRTSIVPHGLQANIARAVARIACRDGVDARWVDIWISSETIQWWLSRNAREVARKTLNLSELSTVPIAIPPLDEQSEIVRRVESLFALADQLEARYTTARTHIDRLTPALLAKAFRGELVPQDPSDTCAIQTGNEGRVEPQSRKARSEPNRR